MRLCTDSLGTRLRKSYYMYGIGRAGEASCQPGVLTSGVGLEMAGDNIPP